MQSKQNTTIQSKQLPQALKIERLVLGALLIDSNASEEVMTIFQDPNVFNDSKNQLVFKAIHELWNLGNPIDLATVSHQLQSNGKLEAIGGDFALIALMQAVSSSAHVEHHSRILLQEHVKRSVILFNAKITALAYDDSTDIFDLLQRWQKEFDKVMDLTSKGRKTMDFPSALDHLRSEVMLLSNNTDEVPLVGVHTGFKRTNKHTGGYRNQDLIIVAARPGMGKTAKVLKTAIENVKMGNPVGFISLEMSVHQLTARAMAIDSSFHLSQLLKTGFEHAKYLGTFDDHSKRMKQYPLIIDDSGENDITDIVIKAKMWKRVHGIKLLIVDYLQLMGDNSVRGNRENEVSNISRRLKRLAKELDIPVIALSQLSRAVETRGGSKRPLLSDLRESGAIEQDADIIEFIYRPEYYHIEMDENEYELQTHKDCIRLGANSEVIFAKYRGGSLATAMLKWVGDKTKFVDVEDSNETLDYIDRNHPIPLGNVSDAFDSNDGKTVFDA